MSLADQESSSGYLQTPSSILEKISKKLVFNDLNLPKPTDSFITIPKADHPFDKTLSQNLPPTLLKALNILEVGNDELLNGPIAEPKRPSTVDLKPYASDFKTEIKNNLKNIMNPNNSELAGTKILRETERETWSEFIKNATIFVKVIDSVKFSEEGDELKTLRNRSNSISGQISSPSMKVREFKLLSYDLELLLKDANIPNILKYLAEDKSAISEATSPSAFTDIANGLCKSLHEIVESDAISNKYAGSIKTVPKDAYILALDSKLSAKGKTCLKMLKDHVRGSHILYTRGQYYAPITSIVQSSGNGKSKLALELISSHPGFYVSFSSKDSGSFPKRSDWADCILAGITSDNLDDPIEPSEFAKSNVNAALVSIFSIIFVYFKSLRQLLPEENPSAEAVSKCIKFLSESFHNEFSWKPVLEKVISKCRAVFNKQSDLVGGLMSFLQNELGHFQMAKMPFVLVIDEAADLLLKNPGRMSIFDIFRHACHLLETETQLLMISISTNSNIIDLNQIPRDDSIRHSNRTKFLNPFVLAGNWDILDDMDYDGINVSPESLLSRDMFLVLASMGRPLWSSVQTNFILDLAKSKLKNGSWETGIEPHLALWGIRTGIGLNPASNIPGKLVKSFMATLSVVGQDSSLYISYPSEPVLAMAARSMVRENYAKSFSIFYQSITNQWVDRGRIAEALAAQIVLISLAEANPEKFNSLKIDSLHNKYRQSAFLMESLVPGNLNHRDSSSIACFLPSNLVYRVESFLKAFCGGHWQDIFRDLKGCAVLKGYINATHFVPLYRDFPFEEKATRTGGLNVINKGMLRAGLLRQCGFIMPTNYDAIDLIIPVCLPSGTVPGRNVYTFIPIQVKIPAAAEGVVSNCMNLDCHYSSEALDEEERSAIFRDQLSIFIHFEEKKGRKKDRSDFKSMEVIKIRPSPRKAINQQFISCLHVNGASAFEKVNFLKDCIDLIRKIICPSGSPFSYAAAHEIPHTKEFVNSIVSNHPLSFFKADSWIRKASNLSPLKILDEDSEISSQDKKRPNLHK